MHYYIAIDPGSKGAIASLDPDGRSAKVKNLSDPPRMDDFAGFYASNCVAVVEEIPMGGWGPIPQSTVAKLHQGYGRILGLLEARGIRTVRVKPQAWQASVGAGSKKYHGKGWKKHLAQIARERFPGVEFTVEQADAILLLDHARRNNL
jgi:hypothetical protein